MIEVSANCPVKDCRAVMTCEYLDQVLELHDGKLDHFTASARKVMREKLRAGHQDGKHVVPAERS